MHSSRMRTGRSLTVCQSLLPRGGGVCSGGVVPGDCLLLGGVCSQGVSAPGGCLLLGGCLLPGDVCSGGCLPPRGGVCSWGGLLLGGSSLGGVSAPGGCGIPVCTEADSPPPWTESQMPVKTLPWPNFVAASKKIVNRKAFQ